MPSKGRDLSVAVPAVAGIGNTIMMLPMLRQLCASDLVSRVTVLARGGAMATVAARAGVAVVQAGGGFRRSMAAVLRVRRAHPHVCLLPYPAARWQYAMLARLLGSRRILVHMYPHRWWHFTIDSRADRIPIQPDLHDVQQNLLLLNALGVRPDFAEAPGFPLTDRERKATQVWLQMAGVKPGEPFVAMHAGSGVTAIGRAKRWPPDRFGELARRIHTDLGLRVGLLEGPDEAGIGEQVVAHAGHVPPIVLRTPDIVHAAGVLQRAQAMVGTDSGLGHLAAAVGTPAAAIFGPSDPDRVCPYGCRDLVVAPRDHHCAPCNPYPLFATHPGLACQEPDCVLSISVDDVFAKLKQALETRLGSGQA